MRRSFVLTLALVLLGGLALTWQACGTSPSKPVGGILAGPQIFNLGDVGSFSLVVTSVEGTQDVTTRATWTSSDSSILAIVGPGRAAGINSGEATITVAYMGLQRSLPVAVSSVRSTQRLNGRVVDGSHGLTGARVTAKFGAATFTAISSFDGSFTISPVVGSGQLTVTLSGFTTVTEAVEVTQNGSVTISMTPAVPPVDVSGSWQLTLTAPGSCAAALPDDARLFTTVASIAQEDTFFTVMVFSDAQPTQPYQLNGQVFDHTITVNFFPDFYYGPVVGVLLRQLGPTRWLLVSGNTTATGTPTALNGTTMSTWAYFETASAADSPLMPAKLMCTGASTTTFQRATTSGLRHR